MGHATPTGLSVADVQLITPDKRSVMLGDRIEVPTIVILARYYG